MGTNLPAPGAAPGGCKAGGWGASTSTKEDPDSWQVPGWQAGTGLGCQAEGPGGMSPARCAPSPAGAVTFSCPQRAAELGRALRQQELLAVTREHQEPLIWSQ